MSRAALFLDRDGVINQPPPPEQRYITRPADFFLMPGIARLIHNFNQARVPVVVVTNQKCIAIGRLSPEGLSAIHRQMQTLLHAEGAFVDAIYHCPHRESDHCTCRKPLPGMLLRGAEDLDLDLAASWLVGDQPRDCQAGKAAGCRTVLFGRSDPSHADLHCPDMQSLQEWSQVFLAKIKETGLHSINPLA